MNMHNETYDLVILNGHIVDPESGWDGPGNIGINGTKIAALSKDPLVGHHLIDAKGLIVAPGFIDLHAHGQTTSAGWMQAFDGVTTALELESGMLGVAQFYDQVKKEGRPLNYGCSSSATSARIAVLEGEEPVPQLSWFFDNFSRPEWQRNLETDEQMTQMLSLIEQGIKEGGVGVGINAGYMPGMGHKEYYRMAELAKKYDVPTFTHVRNVSVIEPNSTFEAIEELIGLSFNPGAHMHICHLNSVSLRDIPDIAQMIQSALYMGANLTVEAYPYGAASTAVGAQFLIAPDWKNRLGAQASDVESLGEPLDDASLTKMQQETPGNVVVFHFLNPEKSEADKKLLATSVLFPGGAIASDAMPWQMTGPGITGNVFIQDNIWPLPEGSFAHPRSAGTFSKFIREYVREQKQISLLEAIRKTALIPAQILEQSTPQMAFKGRLKVGADADIVVFDLDKLSDRATYIEPCQPSVGMAFVIVNGTPIIKSGQLDTALRPGLPVRRPVAA